MKIMKKLLCLVLVAVASGCAAVCPVIQLAAEACPVVVEYLGEDGKSHQVTVPKDYVVEAVAAAAAKQGVSPPKGAVLGVKAAPCAPVKP
jgi:hypothetical protein